MKRLACLLLVLLVGCARPEPKHQLPRTLLSLPALPALTLPFGQGDRPLTAFPWTSATNGWGPVEVGRSNGEDASGDGRSLSIAAVPFATGLGVHAPSAISYALGGKCQYLSADVGIDDEVRPNGSVAFQVFGDDVLLYDSGKVLGGAPAQHFRIDIAGRQILKLIVTDGGDSNTFDHADWAAPVLSGCAVTGWPVGGARYAAPLIITQGGTYSGAWESDDPNVPAVQIKTSQPVILQHCFLRGRGDLITASWVSASLTVRGCQGYGLNPNVAGRFPGRFLQAEGFASVLLEDNYLEKTSGIYLNAWTGQAVAANTLVIRRNQARDLEGRYSDGRGGYQNASYSVQFIQLNNLKSAPRIEIAWNQVENRPRQSQVEDVISVHASSGTAQSPIRVHDNLIYGAYAGIPNASYSGGGIMLGDGGGQYQEASNNTVLETSNYGIAASGGNDLKVLNNTVLGTGKLADGTLLDADPDAGIYLRDYSNDPAHRVASVIAQGNTVGWGHPIASNPNNRWDVSASSSAGLASGNLLAQPAAGAVDPALLAQAVTGWEQRALVRAQP